MKKPFTLIVAFLLFGLFLRPLHVKAAEIDSEIESYQGSLTLHQDNRATFEEKVTFLYHESYNGQYITLGEAGKMPDGFQIEDNPQIRIETNGSSKDPERIEFVPIEDGKKVKIYNPGSSGDRVTITITWQLRNLLFLYSDVAELNWIPISDWEQELEQVHFSILAPSATEAQLFAHTGFLQQAPTVSKNGNRFEVSLKNLGQGRHFELHGIWERSAFDRASSGASIDEKRRSAFEKQEEEIAQKTVFYRRLVYTVFPLLFLVLFLTSLYYLIRYIIATRQKNALYQKARLYEIPQDLPPLLVALNIYEVDIEEVGPLRRKKGALSFSNLVQATLLDLIDRGNLTYLSEDNRHQLELVHYNGLADFELNFIEMVFGTATRVEPATMFANYQIDKKILKGVDSQEEESKVRSEGNEKRSRFASDLRRLAVAVKEEEQRLKLPPHYRSLNQEEKKLMNRGCCLYILLFFLLLLAAILFGMLFGVFLWSYVFCFILVTVVGIILNRRVIKSSERLLSEEFSKEVFEWQSFSNMLRDIARLDKADIDSIVLWNRILVYATLFGYAKKVSRVMKVQEIHLENQELEEFIFTGQNLAFASGVTTLNQYVHTAETASSFSISSDSSSGGFDGGGFSGGGGGGGGGSF